VRMTLLWGGYGKITRQLGNIENNIRFFRKKIMFQNLISRYGSRLRDFGMKHKKRQKQPREIMVSKAGTTWRFGGISNQYTSLQIYGRTILSSWCLSGSHGASNQNWSIYGSVTTHTGGSISFAAHAKWMVRLI